MTCAICLNDLSGRLWNHTKHSFHESCLDQWIDTQEEKGLIPTCPVDKQPIPKSYLIKKCMITGLKTSVLTLLTAIEGGLIGSSITALCAHVSKYPINDAVLLSSAGAGAMVGLASAAGKTSGIIAVTGIITGIIKEMREKETLLAGAVISGTGAATLAGTHISKYIFCKPNVNVSLGLLTGAIAIIPTIINTSIGLPTQLATISLISGFTTTLLNLAAIKKL